MKQDFIREAQSLNMASVNNHFFSIQELEKISGEENTCSLFLRDPRDLLVSGYFYHKKGVEPWTKIKNPTPKDFEIVNGNIPKVLRDSKLSMHEYLNQCDMDEGLMIELEFRKEHFSSLMKWLTFTHKSVLLIDYFDIMQNEARAFTRFGRHHNFNLLQMKALLYFVNKYKASNNKSNKHIRNPSPGQWKKQLTRESLDALDKEFPELISRYNEKTYST
jgi:hypothetical protein